MGAELSDLEDAAAKNRMLTTAISEVLLICAVILIFFVYLELPVTLASAGALGVFFICSLLSWQSFNTARVVLFLSLFASEIAIVKYVEILLMPFVIIDAIAIVVILLSLQQDVAKEQMQP